MTANGLDCKTLMDEVVSYAMQLGVFSSVNKHEPVDNAGTYTASVIVNDIAPAPRASGLTATSARVEFLLRIYVSTITAQLDEVDPNIAEAVSLVLNAFSGGFSLGNTVREVDLLGAHGKPLAAKGAYVNLSGVLFRVMDITIPLVVDDVWSQVP